MSIKDEIQHVKEELSSDEKLLENAFKLERLYKKYKFLIWTLVIVIVAGFGGNAAWNAYLQSKRDAANDAFLTLQQDPNNRAAQAALQENNPRLYDLFRLSQAVHNGSGETLEALAANADPMIADLARYHAAALQQKAVDSIYYHDFSLLEEAYLQLKKGDKAAARAKLALIPETSPAARIAQLLKHYAAQ